MLIPRHLAVFDRLFGGDVRLEAKVVLGKRPGVDNGAAEVGGGEGLILVAHDHQVWEGIELQGPVVVPVHRAGVEGQRCQMALQ